jgi:hypothetical protein
VLVNRRKRRKLGLNRRWQARNPRKLLFLPTSIMNQKKKRRVVRL